MKRGLIAHSTETVATTAVTIAGIAATSENSATNRLCRRAPARAAFRADLSRTSSMPMRTIRMMTTRPSPIRRVETTCGRRQDRREAGENEERRQREHERRADRDRTETGRRSAVVERRRPARARSLWLQSIPEPASRAESRLAIPVAIMQQCCSIATIWRRHHRKVGMSRRLRSRIFLRSVLRLSPRISAALIWLPRVSVSVAAISGASRSCRTRW